MKLVGYLMMVGGGAWCLLHAFDMLRAALYNRRRRKQSEARAALRVAYLRAMGNYARGLERADVTMTTYIVRLDRPADPVKQEIDSITGPQTAAIYPKGS